MSSRTDIFDEVKAELLRATKKFGAFASAHEGYAVLFEEVDELWELVRLKQGEFRDELMRKEAIQVAAMAIRFVYDVCDKKVDK